MNLEETIQNLKVMYKGMFRAGTTYELIGSAIRHLERLKELEEEDVRKRAREKVQR